jgi:hypothetical protein
MLTGTFLQMVTRGEGAQTVGQPFYPAVLSYQIPAPTDTQTHQSVTQQKVPSTTNTLVHSPYPGHRRHRLHNLLVALHARDPARLAHALTQDPRLARRPLEPRRRRRIHPLRRPRLRERLLADLRDCLAVVHFHRVLGLPGTFTLHLHYASSSKCPTGFHCPHRAVLLPNPILRPRDGIIIIISERYTPHVEPEQAQPCRVPPSQTPVGEEPEGSKKRDQAENPSMQPCWDRPHGHRVMWAAFLMPEIPPPSSPTTPSPNTLAGDLSRDKGRLNKEASTLDYAVRIRCRKNRPSRQRERDKIPDSRKQVGSIIQWYESLDKYPVNVVQVKTPGPARGSPSSSSPKGFGQDIKDRAV